jgi:predicted PurR-regulated permease PerM
LPQPPGIGVRDHEAVAVRLERQILFWGIGLAALLLVVYLLGSIIMPFAAGIVLGYLLDPVVVKLQRFGFNRLGASLLILTIFVLFVVLFFILVAPVLSNQFFELARRLPEFAVRFQAFAVREGNALIETYGGGWLKAFGLEQQLSSLQIQKSASDFVSRAAQWLLDSFSSFLSGGAAVFNFLSLLIVTPVVAFYILVDWRRMISKLDSWLPLEHRDTLRTIAREINHALAGFIRGQSIVCLFLGAWYSVGLTLIGLDYGFLIGVVAGVLSFVPYVGSLFALVLSLSVALFQGWPSLKLFLLALGVVGTGQFFEGYVLSPQLVGESIGLHPVWLMFALLAFGQLFGFLGLIIAVPTAAAIGVIARHLIGLYLTSSFYRGASEPESQ